MSSSLPAIISSAQAARAPLHRRPSSPLPEAAGHLPLCCPPSHTTQQPSSVAAHLHRRPTKPSDAAATDSARIGSLMSSVRKHHRRSSLLSHSIVLIGPRCHSPHLRHRPPPPLLIHPWPLPPPSSPSPFLLHRANYPKAATPVHPPWPTARAPDDPSLHLPAASHWLNPPRSQATAASLFLQAIHGRPSSITGHPSSSPSPQPTINVATKRLSYYHQPIFPLLPLPRIRHYRRRCYPSSPFPSSSPPPQSLPRSRPTSSSPA